MYTVPITFQYISPVHKLCLFAEFVVTFEAVLFALFKTLQQETEYDIWLKICDCVDEILKCEHQMKAICNSNTFYRVH